MHSNCILDSVANPRSSHGLCKEWSPKAFHPKGLDPSLKCCCQGPAPTCIKKCG